MKEPKIVGAKVIFGPCRLSYCSLFQKKAFDNKDGGDAKYMTNILIPKNEKETVRALREGIEAARQLGLQKKWGGKLPKKIDDDPLRDGDEKDEKDADVYAGNYYLNAKCGTRPNIVDKRNVPIVDEEEVYSGCWAVVSVTFYPFAKNGNNGIAVGLNNVMKFKDDEHLGGRVSAETDFSGMFDAEDDDDL